MRQRHDDDDAPFFILATKLWGFGLAAVLGTVLVIMVLMPFFQRMDREVTVASHQYVVSQVSALRSLHNTYAVLSVRVRNGDTSVLDQRASVREQMKQIADTIPTNVPQDIRNALEETP